MATITTYNEIVNLRKGRNYMAAYEMAMSVKSEEPDCMWVNNQIAWCLFEMLKANAEVSKSGEFLLRLQELADLNKERPLDAFIINIIVWPIRSFAVSCCSNGISLDDLLYRLWGIMQQIPFDANDENYQILLGALLKAKKWGGLKGYIDWWNLDNLKEKDCEPFKTKEGRAVMSVAEQAYIAYSNILLGEIALKTADEEQVLLFVEKLAKIATKHPEFQYPSYFQAKLLLGIGHKKDAIVALMPFVKKKPKDYWVWDLLGDAEEDENMQMSCYCKALACHAKDQYFRKLHLKLCDLLLKKELYNEARVELVAAIAISNNNGWVLPYKYQDYTTESWFVNANKTTDNNEFYRNNSSAAEALTYADYPQTTIVVVKINKEKKVANFVTTDHKEGFFSFKSFGYKIGGTYICRMENDGGSHYKIYTAMPVDEQGSGLVKSFSGTLLIKQGGYSIVDGVYIPAFMLKNHEDGIDVIGKAFPSFDQKRGKWGWTAFHIESTTK